MEPSISLWTAIILDGTLVHQSGTTTLLALRLLTLIIQSIRTGTKRTAMVRDQLGENKEVHGKVLEPFLGFYDVQLQALQALMEAMNKAYDIPL